MRIKLLPPIPLAKAARRILCRASGRRGWSGTLKRKSLSADIEATDREIASWYELVPRPGRPNLARLQYDTDELLGFEPDGAKNGHAKRAKAMRALHCENQHTGICSKHKCHKSCQGKLMMLRHIAQVKEDWKTGWPEGKPKSKARTKTKARAAELDEENSSEDEDESSSGSDDESSSGSDSERLTGGYGEPARNDKNDEPAVQDDARPRPPRQRLQPSNSCQEPSHPHSSAPELGDGAEETAFDNISHAVQASHDHYLGEARPMTPSAVPFEEPEALEFGELDGYEEMEEFSTLLQE